MWFWSLLLHFFCQLGWHSIFWNVKSKQSFRTAHFHRFVRRGEFVTVWADHIQHAQANKLGKNFSEFIVDLMLEWCIMYINSAVSLTSFEYGSCHATVNELRLIPFEESPSMKIVELARNLDFIVGAWFLQSDSQVLPFYLTLVSTHTHLCSFNCKCLLHFSFSLKLVMTSSCILICLFIILITHYPLLCVASTLLPFSPPSFRKCWFFVYCSEVSCVLMSTK